MRNWFSFVCAVFWGFAAANAADLGYDPSQTTGDISVDKQYIVSTSCRYKGSLASYMKRIDKYGNYKDGGGNASGSVKIGHVVGFVTSETSGFSDAYSTPAKVASNDLPAFTVFARDISDDTKILRRTSVECRARWMITGQDASKIKVAAIFASSNKPVGTELISSILVFSKAVLTAGRQLFLNKSLNTSQSDDFETADQLIDDFNTFVAIFEGEVFDDLGAKPLRVGTQRVFTEHTDFLIKVEETDSFLHSALPFRDTADDFLSDLASNYWGTETAGELTKEDRVAFRAKCENFVTYLLGNGVVSSDDQAYLLARSLILKGVTKVNLMRCFWDADLGDAFLRDLSKESKKSVRQWIQSRHRSSAIFDANDFENWQRNARDWDLKIEDWKPEQTAEFGSPESSSKALDNFLSKGSFYPFLDLEVDPNDHTTNLKRLNSAFLPKLIFVDNTGVFSNKELFLSPVEMVRLLASKGYNRLGCSKKALKSTLAKFGQSYFADAQFVFLAHLAEPLTYKTKDVKNLHPDRAIVARGYTDPLSNKISMIEMTLEPAGILFDDSETCAALKGEKT